jgi:hypothetical protein
MLKACLASIACFCLVSVGMGESPIHLRGIQVWRNSGKIEINGIINMREGLIELLATTPKGKEHESILVLHCNPSLLQTALILIGLNSGGGGKYPGDTAPLYGDKVYIYVQWKEKDKTRLVRAEDMIWDKKHNKVMPPTAWIFTGSRFETNAQGLKIFKANEQGVLVATYYDPDAIINNPLPERTDDTVYYANKERLPAPKTPVIVILSKVPIIH